MTKSSVLATLGITFCLACSPESPKPTEVETGSFQLVSRNGKALPQRTVATPTDTLDLLGGEILLINAREYHVIDSVRVVVRDATQWYADIHRSLRVGYGSIVGNSVSLTWEGGGKGDVIVYETEKRLMVYRQTGDTLLYTR